MIRKVGGETSVGRDRQADFRKASFPTLFHLVQVHKERRQALASAG